MFWRHGPSFSTGLRVSGKCSRLCWITQPTRDCWPGTENSRRSSTTPGQQSRLHYSHCLCCENCVKHYTRSQLLCHLGSSTPVKLWKCCSMQHAITSALLQPNFGYNFFSIQPYTGDSHTLSSLPTFSKGGSSE